MPLRKIEIDGIRFYYSRGNEPQDPHEMGAGRELYHALEDMSGEVAIDIGAHIGSYALRLAKRFNNVIAFEPNPFNRHILSLNVHLNGATNIRVEDAAVSEDNGVSSFFLHRGADGTGSLNEHHYGFKYDKMIEVKTRTLDSFDLSRIDLLKIDAEGNELRILKGGFSTLKKTKPTLAIEVHQARITSDKSCSCETCEYLRSRNYIVDVVGDYDPTPVHWIVARPSNSRSKSESTSRIPED